MGVTKNNWKLKVVWGIGVAAVLGSIGIAFYSYNTLTNRPGEAALRLVPEDALVVGSLDLMPSISQVLTFKRIEDSLSRHYGKDGVKNLESLLGNAVGMIDPELAECVGTGVAFAMMPTEPLLPKDPSRMPNSLMMGPNFALIINLKDSDRTQRILEKIGKPQFFRGAKYFTRKGSPSEMVIEGFMVMEDHLIYGSPGALWMIKQVIKGEEKSIVDSPSYARIRSRVAEDANFMAYISPKMLRDMSGGMPSARTQAPIISDWMSFGLAIRDEGLEISGTAKYNIETSEAAKLLANWAPLGDKVYDRLPSGAYGAIAVSELGRLAKFTLDYVGQMFGESDMNIIEREIRKVSGLGINEDFVPALSGNTIVAFYPEAPEKLEGMDMLVVIEDQRQADPAALATRLRVVAEQAYANNSEGTSPLFVPTKEFDCQAFELSKQAQSDTIKVIEEESFGAPVKNDLLNKKTFAYALVGKTFVGATSKHLLERAVTTYRSGENSMTSDILAKVATTDAQSILVADVNKIAKGVVNSIDTKKMTARDRKDLSAVQAIFDGIKQPLHARGKVVNGESISDVFVPIQLDKVIDATGSIFDYSGNRDP